MSGARSIEGRFGRGTSRRCLAPLLALLAFAHPLLAAEVAGQDGARKAATTFGRALTSGHASVLRAVLPSAGKVHLAASHLVPEEGSFGASQVEALLADFLAQGAVRSFEVLRLESDGTTSALAEGRAILTDRQGHPARLGIHLSFQTEDGRWVLREIKETLE